MDKPKQLRSTESGRVFSYTEELAKRSDMVAIADSGESLGPWKETKDKPSNGLKVDDVSDNLKVQLRQKDRIILRLEKDLAVLSSENSTLLDRIAALEANDTPDAEPEEAKTESEVSERLESLTAACLKMIMSDNPNDFTGSGLPRIERLEELSGISDVNAKERTKAFEKAKELM